MNVRTGWTRRRAVPLAAAATLVAVGAGLVVMGLDDAAVSTAQPAGAASEAPTAGAASAGRTDPRAPGPSGSGPSGSTSTDSTSTGSGSTASGSAGPKPTGGRQAVPVAGPERKRAERDARAAIKANPKPLRAAKADAYRFRDVVADSDGGRHVRFDRTHRGLAVLGGDVVVHTAPNGTFHNATVAQDAPIDVSTTPTVSRATATATAVRRFTGTRRGTTADLVVDAFDGAPRLAWRVVVDGVATSGMPSRLNVIVDARTGAVRRSYDEVEGAENGTGKGLHLGDVPLSTRRQPGGDYELIDPDRGNGETRDALDESPVRPTGGAPLVDADNVWGDGTRADRASEAVDVHHGVQQTWDYFKQTHGRNGIRDDGKGATAFVHDGLDEANASWFNACFCMYFGSGKAPWLAFTQLDIVGHEMTHGITRATANLTYAGESGGLNEATSDIFGTMVEFDANNPLDPPDYLIGEKTHVTGEPIRRMDRPAADGYSASCWDSKVKDLDVHESSGIGNKFFYTLAVGSATSQWGSSPPCSGAPPVTGIGRDKAAQIWYRALTTYMVSTTDYAGARLATLSAAGDLFGGDSIEFATVDGAWKAAGVDGTGQSPASQRPSLPDPGTLEFSALDEISYQLVATDPQNDELTFNAVWGMPFGLSLSPSGLITGHAWIDGNDFAFIQVRDPLGHMAELSLKFKIATPPRVVAPGPQRTPAGTRAYLAVSADDWRGRAMSYTARGLPPGLSISATTGEITGKPSATGRWTVTVEVVIVPTGARTAVTFDWTVTPAPPGAPTAVAVRGGTGTATVTWGPPTAAGSGTITGYVVDGVAGRTVRLPATARTTALSGLAGGTTYRIAVRATSTVGDGPKATVTLTGVTSTVTAAPASVRSGAATTLSGRLTPVGGGTATAARSMQVQHLPAGQRAWKPLATVVTTRTGTWSRVIKPTANAAYRTVLVGGPGLLANISPARTVTVSYAVTLKAATTTPRAGAKVAITGTQKPARAGTKVTLQRLSGRSWVTVSTTTTRANGTYAFSRTFTRGTITLRATLAGGPLNTTGTSPTVKLTVR